MGKKEFLELLKGSEGWQDMLNHGKAGVSVTFKGVEFLIFRDAADHYLKYEPTDGRQKAIIHEFNDLLLCECRDEIEKEMKKWSNIRLYRDDSENDN